MIMNTEQCQLSKDRCMVSTSQPSNELSNKKIIMIIMVIMIMMMVNYYHDNHGDDDGELLS